MTAEKVAIDDQIDTLKHQYVTAEKVAIDDQIDTLKHQYLIVCACIVSKFKCKSLAVNHECLANVKTHIYLKSEEIVGSCVVDLCRLVRENLYSHWLSIVHGLVDCPKPSTAQQVGRTAADTEREREATNPRIVRPSFCTTLWCGLGTT